MNCIFRESDKNELRMKIENGKITEVLVFYENQKGMVAGIAELKKMGFYPPKEQE